MNNRKKLTIAVALLLLAGGVFVGLNGGDVVDEKDLR